MPVLGTHFPVGQYRVSTAGHHLSVYSIAPTHGHQFSPGVAELTYNMYNIATASWLVLQVYAVYVCRRFLFCTACVEFIRQPTWIRVHLHLSASPVITPGTMQQSYMHMYHSDPVWRHSTPDRGLVGALWQASLLFYFLLAQVGV